jgi:hypothetical protein
MNHVLTYAQVNHRALTRKKCWTICYCQHTLSKPSIPKRESFMPIKAEDVCLSFLLHSYSITSKNRGLRFASRIIVWKAAFRGMKIVRQEELRSFITPNSCG